MYACHAACNFCHVQLHGTLTALVRLQRGCRCSRRQTSACEQRDNVAADSRQPSPHAAYFILLLAVRWHKGMHGMQLQHRVSRVARRVGGGLFPSAATAWSVFEPYGSGNELHSFAWCWITC